MISPFAFSSLKTCLPIVNSGSSGFCSGSAGVAALSAGTRQASAAPARIIQTRKPLAAFI